MALQNQAQYKILTAALLCTLAGAAAAAEPDLRQAAQMIDRHYYESAAAMLRPAASEPNARFLLGRAYAGNAALYRALARSSLVTGERYLKKLVVQHGRDRSRMAALYYAEYLIEAGKTKAGMAQLSGFLGAGAVPAPYRDIAEVRLAVSQGRGAAGLRQAKMANPLVRAQIAAALSRSDKTRAQGVALMDGVLSGVRGRHDTAPMRVITNAIEVYARAGDYDKAFALLANADLSRPSYEEAIGKSKTLRFYDPALLGNLALLYQGAAERTFAGLAGDARLKDIAGFFLAESQVDGGEAARAAPQLASLASAADLPAAYRDRVLVLQAAVEARRKQAAKANAAFADLGARHAQDPVVLGEVLRTCVEVHARCDAIAANARRLAASGQGERFRSLHRAVGMQYLAAHQTERALPELETARDKANKNKVDTNDPLLLVTLADLYLETKSFSENLEIYFELSKEFPAVRQLQEAGQGIYSMEYRSAGDVKIF
jgi:tetratricopeptide (TPR) repeat protein